MPRDLKALWIFTGVFPVVGPACVVAMILGSPVLQGLAALAWVTLILCYMAFYVRYARRTTKEFE